MLWIGNRIWGILPQCGALPLQWNPVWPSQPHPQLDKIGPLTIKRGSQKNYTDLKGKWIRCWSCSLLSSQPQSSQKSGQIISNAPSCWRLWWNWSLIPILWFFQSFGRQAAFSGRCWRPEGFQFPKFETETARLAPVTWMASIGANKLTHILILLWWKFCNVEQRIERNI